MMQTIKQIGQILGKRKVIIMQCKNTKKVLMKSFPLALSMIKADKIFAGNGAHIYHAKQQKPLQKSEETRSRKESDLN
jgi:hypothetical protein